MRAILRTGFFCAALLITAATTAFAQEGHPLKGSWIGTWEGNKELGEFVLVVLDWDGQKISGVINPGTDDIAIKSATLDPEKWMVHIEADAKLASGGTDTYVIDGTIQDLALPNRYITGTWKSRNGSGDFEIRRQ